PPTDTEVLAVDVSVIGATDGKIIGVDSTMEYQKQEADPDDWTAITGTEVTDLGIGIYYVRYKETGTHNASDTLEVIISNPTDPVEEEPEAPIWAVDSTLTAHTNTNSVTLTWDAE